MENTGTTGSYGSQQGLDLRDGSRIISLHDLFYKIKQMDENTFHIYVNNGSNILADWVGISLAKPGLARLLRQNNDKSSFEILLQTYLSEDIPVAVDVNRQANAQIINQDMPRQFVQNTGQDVTQIQHVQSNDVNSNAINGNNQNSGMQQSLNNNSNNNTQHFKGNNNNNNNNNSQQEFNRNNNSTNNNSNIQTNQSNNNLNPNILAAIQFSNQPASNQNNDWQNRNNNNQQNQANVQQQFNGISSNGFGSSSNGFSNQPNQMNQQSYNQIKNNDNQQSNGVIPNSNMNHQFNPYQNNHDPQSIQAINSGVTPGFNDAQVNHSYEPPRQVSEPTQKDNGEILIEEAKKVSISTQDVDNRKIEVPQPQKIVVANPATPQPVHPSSPPAQSQILSEAEAKRYSEIIRRSQLELSKVIKGQEDVLEKVFMTLICDAHALLEGVPGLAKSFLVEALTKVITGTSYKRIQFMPDILPADVIGSQIYNPQKNEFVTMKGPIFANFVLADEINRAPPKTHAALMEAMQEKKINIEKDEYILDRPFLVLATQNPLENKGTYALPEAVLDRFMFKIILNYPKREDEKIIIVQNATVTSDLSSQVIPTLTKELLLEMQKAVKKVYLSARIKDYILDLVEATRGQNKDIVGLKFIEYGAGPRASIYLGIAARAQAMIHGRNYVLPEDLKEVAPYILRHRVCLNFKAKAHKISSDKIVEEILSKVNAL